MLKSMVPAMFARIRETKDTTCDEAELHLVFCIDNGVDAKDLTRRHNSFAVNSMHETL
ncbi:hypothetical protein OK016_15410 [Vibrio chagasii]|nr:hypothetical protein [Vibrio chagasii]